MPEPFASFARRCLRSDPARRITISEIAARLEPAKVSPEPVAKPAKIPFAKRRVAILASVAAVLLAAIGIWRTLSDRERPSVPAQQTQTAPAATPTPAPAPLAPAAPTQNSPEAPAQADASAPPSEPDTTSTPQAQPPVTASTPVPAAVAPPQSKPRPQADQGPAIAASPINPAIVNQILPEIAPSAMKTINGTLRVSVAITVGSDGIVTDATPASPGPSKYFTGKSLEAARHWKFKPAAAGSWTLEFQYTQTGIHVIAEPAAP